MKAWLSLAFVVACLSSIAADLKKSREELARICRDQGGAWVTTTHGERGCKCPSGQYLKNVYFEVCNRAKPKSLNGDANSASDASMTSWGQKGQSWALSKQSRSFSTSNQVLSSFLQSVNSQDFDGALSLVNDFEVHPSRELDGVNELLRRFKSVSSRDQEPTQIKTFGSVAEPQAKWSGCHYLEEYLAILVDGQDKSRVIGRMTIYCAHLSVSGQGKHPIDQARRECLQFRPTNPQFSCKVGRIEML